MTNSLINNIMEGSKSEEPKVGMGATELCWTDRHAYTIVEIRSPKRIKVQQDRAIRTDNLGMSDAQQYRYERDPEAPIITLSLRKDGKWRQVGCDGNTFKIGYRSEYHDYSF